MSNLKETLLAAGLILSSTLSATTHEVRAAENYPSTPEEETTALRAALLADFNSYRESINLAPLREVKKLDEIAEATTEDMSKRQYISHISPTNDTVFTRLAANNIKYKKVSEVIAWNDYSFEDTEQVAFKTLMDNPPHKEVIEVAEYSEVGIGEFLTPEGVRIFDAILLSPSDDDTTPHQGLYAGKGPYVE